MIAIGREYFWWDADNLWEILGKLEVPDISNCSFNTLTLFNVHTKAPKFPFRNWILSSSGVESESAQFSTHSTHQKSNALIKGKSSKFLFKYTTNWNKEIFKKCLKVSNVWFSVIYHFGNLSYTFQSIFLPLLSRKETYLAFFLIEIKLERAAIVVFWYSWLNTGFSREKEFIQLSSFFGGIWVFGDDCKGTETLNWWLSISLLSPISLCRKWICWAFLAAKCHIMEICAILSLRKSTFAKTQKSNIFNLHQSQEM